MRLWSNKWSKDDRGHIHLVRCGDCYRLLFLGASMKDRLQGLASITKIKPSTFTPPSNLWDRKVYKTGDGDMKYPVRPGAEDFLRAPSLLVQKK